MPLEFCNEVMEIITMAVDKYSAQSNYEAACQLIKTQLDKKYGAAWHCCIGEGLAFEITYQQVCVCTVICLFCWPAACRRVPRSPKLFFHPS